MKFYLGLLFTGSVFFCIAQKKSDPVPFGNTIQPENLRKHLYQIAGPEFEGRETATPGQRKAAAYIEDYFKSLGLQPGNGINYQLGFPVFQDSLISAFIQINGDSFQLNRDFDIRLATAYSVFFGATEIVFAGYGISDSLHDDYKDLQVAGKIVLVTNTYPPGLLQKEINAKTFNAFAKQD